MRKIGKKTKRIVPIISATCSQTNSDLQPTNQLQIALQNTEAFFYNYQLPIVIFNPNCSADAFFYNLIPGWLMTNPNCEKWVPMDTQSKKVTK